MLKKLRRLRSSMSKKTKTFKYILFAIVIFLLIGLAIYLFPVIRNLSTPEGQLEFEKQVDNMGVLGFLALFGLQFAQIFLIILLLLSKKKIQKKK